MFSYFAEHSLWVLIPSLLLLLASIVCFVYGKQRAAIITLVIAAFGIRIFMAGLDPFLHPWDERYHALVAKNLMHHPLKPTLFDREILPYDYTQWVGNHIWLHKQPLALWQMALSYKLFGISTFTTNLPTAILSTLMVLLIYDMARKCFNAKAAYFSALIYTLSYYTLNFSTGGEAVDHVDFAFFFYVTASFWAWINYDISKENKWRILVGVFAGLAVLTKWVTGLLVFAGWGIVVLADAEQRKSWTSYFTIAKTALISLAIFLPWQIYTFIKFPKEAFHELSYNRRHMFEVIEGHSGSFWYYIQRLDENYGWLAPYIIIPALYLVWRKARPVSSRNFMFAVLFVCYLFFSSCATKMPAYCHAVLSVIFIAFGVFTEYLYNVLIQRLPRYRMAKAVAFAAICLLAFKVFEINTISWFHTTQDSGNINRQNQVRFTAYYKKLGKNLPNDVVVFGAPFDTEIEAMFFTGNIVYNNFPDEEKYKSLKSAGEKMAVFVGPETPAYLKNDPAIQKLYFNY